MIKVILGGNDGRKLVLLGLTRENIERLTAGQPIAADLGGLGVPDIRVAIHFGEDQEALLRDIKEQLGVDIPTDLPVPRPGEAFGYKP
jgi:hypothetical protein